MKRGYKDYIVDVVDAIDKIERFTENMEFNDFESDDKTLLAVVKSLEIIGEAVKKIPENVRKIYPEIPWSKIAGMRDKLVHEYFGINIKVVWRTIKEDIPSIKPTMKEMLEKLEREERSKKL